MQAGNIETTVLTTRSRHEKSSTQAVRRWPVLRDRSGAVRGHVQYASFDLPLFFRLLLSPKASVVVVEPPPTTGAAVRLACWLRRTPYVYFSADVTSSAAQSIGVNPAVVTLVRALERWVLRGAALILAVSDDVKAEVVSLGADGSSVVVVGTGIDTTQFSLDGPRPTVTYPYFVYAGTMSEMQGAGIFVEAFARVSAAHPTARLKMFGDGVEALALQQRARDLGLDRVEFLGQVGAQELAPWLRGAHAGLASSRPRTGYNFAISTKTFSSLSCGAPVIYAGDGPVRELIVNHDLGWAVRWDATKVAAAMESALRDSPDGTHQKRRAEWVHAHYSLEQVASHAATAILANIEGRDTA